MDFNALAAQQPQQLSSTVSIETSRAVAEAQGAMVIAKKFPRDQVAAYQRIMKACQRKILAEQSMYAFPRGGQMVTGPSIRLAEAIAQNWGNIDFGIVEIDQRDGESTMMSYAVDLETNVKQTRIFVVKHERTTKKKGTVQLDDARDIYELTANQGARRLRACILGVIPADIIEGAIEQCEKTIKGTAQEPLIDRAKKMVSAFSDFGVSQEMIEAKLGHKVDAIIENELLSLRKIYQSIKDGVSGREQWFTVEAKKDTSVEDKLSGFKPQENSISARLMAEQELDLRGK